MIIRENQSEHSTSAGFARGSQRSYSRFTVRTIDEAKSRVPTLELAERICGPGDRRGQEVYFECPLHDDHDPSLRVNAGSGLWFCDPCAEGGDAITLAQRCWQIERADEAAAHILLEFRYPIPPRPASWHGKNERQQPIRDAIDRARFEHLRRRLFRTFFRASVAAIEDDEEREQEYRVLWDASEPLALMMLDEVKARARRRSAWW
jgi:hypothetical protein